MAHRPPATRPVYVAALLLGAVAMNSVAATDASVSPAPTTSLPTAAASTTAPSGFSANRDSVFGLHNNAADGADGRAAMFDRPVTMIELPREVRLGAAPQRAHHALGFRSQAAESWLRDHGIGAKTCYLPMLRLPARITPSGDASIAFWLYARCSFF